MSLITYKKFRPRPISGIKEEVEFRIQTLKYLKCHDIEGYFIHLQNAALKGYMTSVKAIDLFILGSSNRL
jgi:hypothetical protein